MRRTPLESWVAEKTGNQSVELTRGGIERYQWMRLRETLAWAKQRSAFYKRRLADVAPHDLVEVTDLRHIPFTTAEDLKGNPLGFLCVSQGEVERVVTLQTSGTTGEPKRIFFTREEQELTIDFFQVGMSTLVGPGDRVLILLPGERPGSVGDLLATGLRRMGAEGIVLGPVREYREALGVMVRERIDAIVGIPVQLLALARYSRGMAPPRSVLVSTDHVPEAISRELRRIWGCEVFAHYGMTEMGFGGGVECEAGAGYHMREADLLFEIVNPETGAPLEEGETGEAVFTTLTRRGMPLIRYRTGDLSRFLPETCPCGTVLKTMAPVKGRISGRIKVGPGEVLAIVDLDEALFNIPGLVDFSAALTRENGLDCLRITGTFTHGEDAGTVAAIHNALKKVSTIQAGLNHGRLTVSVIARKGDPLPLNGTAKRRINDERN